MTTCTRSTGGCGTKRRSLSTPTSLWLFSRFADVQAAGRDWKTFSSAEGVDIDDSHLGPGSFLEPLRRVTELRKIVQASFAPPG